MLRQCRQVEHQLENLKAPPKSCYEELINSRVLGQRHRYNEIEAKMRVRARSVTIRPTVRDIRAREATLDCSNIVGRGSPKYYSPKAEHLPVEMLDLELVRRALSHGHGVGKLSAEWLRFSG